MNSEARAISTAAHLGIENSVLAKDPSREAEELVWDFFWSYASDDPKFPPCTEVEDRRWVRRRSSTGNTSPGLGMETRSLRALARVWILGVIVKADLSSCRRLVRSVGWRSVVGSKMDGDL